MQYQIIQGDALTVLRTLPSDQIDTCVTSPPYFGLRDYGTGQWEGGDTECEHKVRENPRIQSSGLDGGKGTVGHSKEGFRDLCPRCGARRIDNQIGLERTPDEYVARLVEVFREVRRVLKPQGCLWLNLGDSYAGSWGNQGRKEERGSQRPINGPMIQNLKPYPAKQSNTGKIPEGSGLKPKDLIGIPWTTAFALRSDGWWLRSEVIWNKVNPMPESVTDRPTKSHEQVFLLAKSERYYYDIDAIREPFQTDGCENYPARAHITGRGDQGAAVARGNDRGKSGGFPPASHKGSSFNRGKTGVNGMGRVSDAEREDNPLGRNKRSVWTIATTPYPAAHFAVMPQALVEPCILAGCPESGTVLDPFCGSGTVGAVALLHKRNFIGIDLNPDYIQMARRRLYQASSPLLGDVEVSAAG